MDLSRRASPKSIAILLTLSFLNTASNASAEDVYNLTGLPIYPNLTAAKMDRVVRTDTMGHWCSRFAAETSAPLEIVEDWYRKVLVKASETDLNNDARYKNYFELSGIKLAVGIDYVTVFRTGSRSVTSIELFRCSPP